MRSTRVLKDVPELVAKLRAEKAREKDFLAPQGKIKVALIRGKEKGDVALDVQGQGIFEVSHPVHAQIYGRMEIPGKYYRKMRDGSPEDRSLLALNVNHWLGKDAGTRRLIRCIADARNSVTGIVRAFLSDRYRPISHLDLLTSVVQVITGERATQSGEESWAKGAKCFDWALSPTKIDVCFLNPELSVDIDNLDGGWHKDEAKGGNEGWHSFVRTLSGTRVFPATRIRNSETGHGGLVIESGIYEAACRNAFFIGTALSQVHVGKVLQEEDFWSAETMKHHNRTIYSAVSDITRKVFDPVGLLELAKKFKGLESVKVEDVREATTQIVSIAGMTEDIRDEILATYYADTEHRDNLHDLTRAVTATAHAYREDDPETAAELETLGGKMVAKGKEVLA